MSFKMTFNAKSSHLGENLFLGLNGLNTQEQL